MSDIRFGCRYCNNPLTIDADGAGQTVACPHCGKDILVPDESQSDFSPNPPRKKTLLVLSLIAAGLMLGAWGVFSFRSQTVSIASNSTNPTAATTPTMPPARANLNPIKNEGELIKALLSTEAPSGTLWLESLDPLEGGTGAPQTADRAYPNSPIRMGDKVYQHGLWSHDRDSLYEVAVNGKAARLSMMVGLIDSNGKHGHLKFIISADGKAVADSGFIQGGEAPKLLIADLTGVQRVSVRVDTGGDGNWANPGIGGALIEVAPDEYVHAAAFSGRIDELKRSLKNNPNQIDTVDGLLGVSPFWAACLGGQTESAMFLCQAGADRNSVDSQKNTVVHFAAAHNHAQAIFAAARAGTDFTLRNADGRTAHEVAARQGNAKVLALLTEAEMWNAPQELPPPAPSFEVTDAQDQKVSLADFRGKNVALFFHCDMPWDKNFQYRWLDYAESLQRSPEAKANKLVVLVPTPNEPAAAKAFMAEHGYTFLVLYDPKDSVRRQLHL